MPLSSGQGRVIIRWAMASDSQNVCALVEFGRNMQLAAVYNDALDSIRVGKGKALGTVGKGTKGGRQSASADGNKGKGHAKGKGKGKAIQDPNDILFTCYIPVEESWQAVGSVILKATLACVDCESCFTASLPSGSKPFLHRRHRRLGAAICHYWSQGPAYFFAFQAQRFARALPMVARTH